MNHSDRLILGELCRKCDEKKLEITLGDNGQVIAFKKYCRAKDFRRGIDGNSKTKV